MTEDIEQPKGALQETEAPVSERAEEKSPPVDPELLAQKQAELGRTRELSRADTVGAVGNAEANIRTLQAKAELQKKGGEMPAAVFGALDRSLRKFVHVIGTAAVLSAGLGIEQALYGPVSAATLEKQPGISSIADQDNYEKMRQSASTLESEMDEYAQTHEQRGNVRITYFSEETKQALEQQGIEINNIGIMANTDTSLDARSSVGGILFHAEGIRYEDHLDKTTEVEQVLFKLLKDGTTVEGAVQYQDGHSGFFLVRNGVIEIMPSKK